MLGGSIEMRAVDDSTDWIGIVTTILTLLAVAVALFGPMLHRRWIQPVVTLSRSHDEGQVVGVAVYDDVKAQPVDRPRTDKLLLEVHNRADRERAQDVEVFVSGKQRAEQDSIEMVFRETRLRFIETHEVTAAVAAGFRRSVLVLDLEPSYELDGRHLVAARLLGEGWTPTVGFEAQPIPSWQSEEWDFTFTVTGSNFNAVSFEARVLVSVGTQMSEWWSPDAEDKTRQVVLVNSSAAWKIAPKQSARRRT
jgi:hypothetical protein